MIGSADDDGIDLLALTVDHLAEVAVFFRLGPAGETLRATFPIDVGKSDHVFHARFRRD